MILVLKSLICSIHKNYLQRTIGTIRSPTEVKLLSKLYLFTSSIHAMEGYTGNKGINHR